MKTSSRIAKNFLSLSAAEAFSRVLGAVLNIYVARILGVIVFGQLNFALAVSSYLNIFTDFGLTMFGIREIAKERGKLSFIATNVLFLQTLIAIVLVIILGISLLFLPLDPTLKLVTWLFGLGAIPVAVNVSYVFQAYESMEFSALVRVIGQLGYVILGFIFIYLLRSIIVLPIASVLAYFIAALISIVLIKSRYGFFFEQIKWFDLWMMIRKGLPFVLIGLSVQIYFNIDSILLQFIKGAQEVGYYNSGYKLINLLILGSNLLLGAFYPLLVAKFHNDQVQFEKAVRYLSKISGIIAIPLAAGGYLLASRVIYLLYGPAYSPGSLAFGILVLAIPIIFLNGVLGTLINSTGAQKKLTIATIIGAVFNITVNIFVIPIYGLNGAAVVTLLTEALVFAVILWFVKDYQFKLWSSIKSFVLSPILPTLGMVGTLLIVSQYNPNIMVNLTFALLSYLIGLYIFKVVKSTDLLEIRGILVK